jgi:hypothetical protein
LIAKSDSWQVCFSTRPNKSLETLDIAKIKSRRYFQTGFSPDVFVNWFLQTIANKRFFPYALQLDWIIPACDVFFLYNARAGIVVSFT